jgi:hypothetical protein
VEIGKHFGRDHGTVIHAQCVITDRMEHEPDLRDRVTAIRLRFADGGQGESGAMIVPNETSRRHPNR